MELRFNTFSQYLKKKYPFKVHKIAIDAGFTCPNRDGRKGTGGCTYCLNKSFSPYADTNLSLAEQFEKSYRFYKSKYPHSKFIVYLQAYSNTYAPVAKLRRIYDQAVNHDDVIGLSVGTRPDCISESTLELLQSYMEKVDVWLEIGCESTHDRTLRLINRCHTYSEFEEAITKAAARNLRLVTHMIFGLPDESYEDMMVSVDRIAALPINDIKIHHLYISPSTPMEEDYRRGKIRLFSLDEWVNLCCDIIERLPPTMVIQRLVGELSGEYVIAPRWGKSKSAVYSLINDELTRRGTMQGSKALIRTA